MANIDLYKQKLNNIADAIRTKLGEDIQYTLEEMPDKILSISGGGSGEKLPDGYTRLSYIKHIGAAQADLGITIGGSSKVEIEFAASETNTTQYTTDIFAYLYNSKYYGLALYQPYYVTLYLHTNYITSNNTETKTFSNGFSIPRVISVDMKNRTISVDDSAYNITNNNLFINSGSLIIGYIYNTTNGYYNKGRYYDIKVYQNGAIVNHLIPCFNPSNNLGFYDVINSKFIMLSKTYWEGTI